MRLSLSLSLVVFAAACSTPDSGAVRCADGATAACTCADGRGGTKSCGADHRFTPCRCVDPDAPVLELGGEADPDGVADRLLSFAPAALDGDGVEATLPVRNAGGGTLSVGLSAVERPFAVVELPGPLAAGEAGTLRFRFEPERTGEDEATVSVLSNGGNARIRLVGLGFGPAASCAPSPVELGALLVGVPATFEVTCANEAPAPWPAAVDVSGASAPAVTVALDDPLPGDDGVWRVAGTIVPAGPGPLDVRLGLGAGGEPVAVVELLGTARTELVDVEPALLDLGYVVPGGSATAPVTVRNYGSTAIRVDRVSLVPGADAGFHLDVAGPIDVPGAVDGVPAEAAIGLRFDASPDRTGTRARGTLEVAIAGEAAPRTVSLTAFVGGPVLSCAPTPLAFGEVGIGYPFTVPVTCTNVGVDDPVRTTDRLVVTALSSSDPAFTAVVPGGLREAGYAVGESFEVDVTFAPTVAGPASAVVRLASNSADATAPYELPATGLGVAVTPCNHQVTPPELDFGRIEPGRAATLEFAVQNRGTGPCVLHDLALAPGCDADFVLPSGGFRSALLAAGGELRVPVRFAPRPAAGESFTCEARLDVSSPTSGRIAVPLAGVARASCLSILPGELDFGPIVPGCGSRARRVKLVSVCEYPVFVTGVRTAPTASTEFAVASLPPILPASVAPTTPVTFEVAYRPTGEGDDPGGFLVEVDGSEPYLVPVRGRGASDPVRTDAFDFTDRPKVDALFVIDKSVAGQPQNLLADHADGLLAVARDRAIDFHIGVTTGTHDHAGGCGSYGGEHGRLVPLDNSRPRILTPATPNLAATLAANLRVGSCGTDHLLLDGMVDALAPPLVAECDDPLRPPAADGNCGFSRPTAHLALVAVSAVDDGATDMVPGYYEGQFRPLRDPSQLSFHAVAGPLGAGCTAPGYVARPGTLLSTIASDLGGSFASICPADWEQLARQLSAHVFGHDPCVELGGAPAGGADGVVDPRDLEVELNGLALAPTAANGSPVWTYSAEKHALCFAIDALPAPGAQVEVRYTAACLP